MAIDGILNLAGKQKKFVLAYLANGCTNATAAAEVAGYGTPDRRASELLKHPKIQAYIKQFWEQQAMPAVEVLARLAEQARSPQGAYFDEGGGFDFDRFVADGYGHLIKEIYTETQSMFDDYGELKKRRIKFHDGQTALVWIGKHHKLFTDKIDHSGKITTEIDVVDFGLDDEEDDASDTSDYDLDQA